MNRNRVGTVVSDAKMQVGIHGAKHHRCIGPDSIQTTGFGLPKHRSIRPTQSSAVGTGASCASESRTIRRWKARRRRRSTTPRNQSSPAISVRGRLATPVLPTALVIHNRRISRALTSFQTVLSRSRERVQSPDHHDRPRGRYSSRSRPQAASSFIRIFASLIGASLADSERIRSTRSSAPTPLAHQVRRANGALRA